MAKVEYFSDRIHGHMPVSKRNLQVRGTGPTSSECLNLCLWGGDWSEVQINSNPKITPDHWTDNGDDNDNDDDFTEVRYFKSTFFLSYVYWISFKISLIQFCITVISTISCPFVLYFRNLKT